MMFPESDAEAIDRYRGRPLLLVLENYVLAAIDELSPAQRERMSTFVQATFGGSDDWMATIRDKLSFAGTLDDELRQVWERNRALAAEHGLELAPIHFAQMLVDENFTPMIDRASES